LREKNTFSYNYKLRGLFSRLILKKVLCFFFAEKQKQAKSLKRSLKKSSKTKLDFLCVIWYNVRRKKKKRKQYVERK